MKLHFSKGKYGIQFGEKFVGLIIGSRHYYDEDGYDEEYDLYIPSSPLPNPIKTDLDLILQDMVTQHSAEVFKNAKIINLTASGMRIPFERRTDTSKWEKDDETNKTNKRSIH